jgi:exodeoxyribonuclease VII large subunit
LSPKEVTPYEGIQMNPITVSALSTHIVALFERDDLLRDVTVIGEVSNWKRAGSGHIYFSLKDDGAAISAVMWRGSALAHSWLPREGDQVIATGYVGVYPERGVYQFYANRLLPAGRGQLYVQFEALKAKLAAAGLFDPARKRPIPARSKRIGVVTSRDAAALRDILRVLSARWPLSEVLLFPTLVQGSEAPAQLVAMIEAANRYATDVASLDVLILARGGGSIEDLWAFNDERVAYAVAASVLPVVTGVGHETDSTIVDFVADLRAPTPSAAAVAVTPDGNEIRSQLNGATQWLVVQAGARLANARRDLRAAQRRLLLLNPQRRIDLQRQRLEERRQRLHGALQQRLSRRRQLLEAATQRLDALSPRGVLARGYSIVQANDGRVVVGPVGLAPMQRLHVYASDGSYAVDVAHEVPTG